MNANFRTQLARLLPFLVVLAMVAAACQAAATPPAVPAAPGTAAAAPAAATTSAAPAAAATSAGPAGAKGGTLRIVYYGNEPKLLDAQVDPFDQASVLSGWVSDMLVAKDKDGTFVPWLASEWSVSPDGKSWTFKLRQDVKFQDGTPFNADAVKFNLDRILDPKTQSGQAADMLGDIDKIEVVDPFTVRITHKTPYPPFLDSISQGFIAMWSPTAVQKYGPDEYQRHLTGTGPFKLTEYVPADHYTFVKNPDYKWPPKFFKNQGPAYLDKITVRFISEASTALAVFDSGEADAIFSLPPASLDRYANNPKYAVLKANRTGSPVLFVMNTSKPPLDDINVRRAIEYGHSPEQLVQALFKGNAIPTRAIMYPGSPCYWAGAETLYPYDPAKAKDLLDQAGWKPGPDGIRVKDGKKLQITLVNSFTQELAPLVQAQMKEIGIDATIEQVPGPIQLERAASGDFNLLIQHMAYSDPGVLDMLYNSRNNKAGGWAWTRYLDPKLDQLLNDSDVTIDPQKRCDLLTQAQQIIAQNAIVLPYYGSYSIMVTNANVKDLNYGPRTTVEVWIQDAYVQK